MTETQTQTDQGAGDAAAAAAAAAAATNTQQQQQTQQTQTNGAQKTVAAGEQQQEQKQEQKQEQAKPYWPEDWREKMAEQASAGDKKAYEREMMRLSRISDPSGVYGSYRELDAKFSSGGLVKMPGKDAKPEEIAAFQKALGWAEKPEEMVGQIKLENGAVIGDADKPMLDGFLKAVHGATSASDYLSKSMNWYYKLQEEQAAALDDGDEKFKIEATRALKDEFGPAFNRKTNAIANLFDIAPGGADVKNEKALYSRLMAGRTADGKMIGNDPDMVRWLSALAFERNPSASVVEDGDQSGTTVAAEIASIEKLMRDDRRAYDKDEPKQARLRDLYSARDRMQARK